MLILCSFSESELPTEQKHVHFLFLVDIDFRYKQVRVIGAQIKKENYNCYEQTLLQNLSN